MSIEKLLPIRQTREFRRLSQRNIMLLEREVGHELCPRMEYLYELIPTGTRPWQAEDEISLTFRCVLQDRQKSNECVLYHSLCTYLIQNNEVLKGL